MMNSKKLKGTYLHKIKLALFLVVSASALSNGFEALAATCINSTGSFAVTVDTDDAGNTFASAGRPKRISSHVGGAFFISSQGDQFRGTVSAFGSNANVSL